MKNATANIGKKAIRLFVLEEPQVGRRRVVIQCVPNSFTPLKHKGQPDGKLKSCFLSFDIYSEFLLQLPSSRNAKSIIGFGEASNLLNGRRLLTVFELEESRRRDDSLSSLKGDPRLCLCGISSRGRFIVSSISPAPLWSFPVTPFVYFGLLSLSESPCFSWFLLFFLIVFVDGNASPLNGRPSPAAVSSFIPSPQLAPLPPC